MINRDYYCMSLLYCHDEVLYVQIVNKSMSMSMSCEREFVGSIPGRDRPKSLKLRFIGIALRLARQCQDSGLVK